MRASRRLATPDTGVYTALALPPPHPFRPETLTRTGTLPQRSDMSLILEALKKSEARRNLGEAPGIGTPFTVAPRRRSVLPLLLVLIVVAGGLGWYFLRTPPVVTDAAKSGTASGETIASRPAPSANARPSPAMPVAPATMTANNAGSSAEPVRSPFAAAGRAPPHLGGAAPRPGAEAAPAATASAPTATPHAEPAPAPFGARQGGAAQRALEAAARAGQLGAAGQSPTPLQQRLMQARDARARMPPGAAGSPTVPAPASNPMMPAPRAAAQSAQAAAAQPAQASPPAAPPGPAMPHATNPGASPLQVATANPAPAPGTPKAPGAALSSDVPLYYELPYNVRKDLPTLAISMHVFAAAPDQRFVMIDGERKAEGDTFKDLTLREIRPDGMVLEFRGQRFFYPRSGH